MTLFTIKDVSLKFGDQVIFNEINFELKKSQRVCLLGRNGSGKSTFFNIVTEKAQPDSGLIIKIPGLKIKLLSQDLPHNTNLTVKDYLASGLKEHTALLNQYHLLSERSQSEESLQNLEKLQTEIESGAGWNIDNCIEKIATELDLPLDAILDHLSGGWKRRVSFARAVINEPNVLLLDEPTNHLDIATIEWLEKKLINFRGSLVFTTHDRYFLRNICTKIVELDRGKIFDWGSNFEEFLRRKNLALYNEKTKSDKLTKKLAVEEEWLRQGVKARGTKNEGRKKAIDKLRNDHTQIPDLNQRVKITIQNDEASSRKVIQIYNLSFSYNKDTKLINGLSLIVARGQKIGLVGNNGVGKSTLLDLITGSLQPEKGTIKLSESASIGYFNQKSESFDLDKSVADYVGEGKDYISIKGKDRHVVGYLKGFLFSSKRALTPIRYLSGGERNRAKLAKLFTKPANLLILDEPTNDLDVETIEALEDQITSFDGTLIISSHDRYFLDRVASHILVFETEDRINSYAGGFSQWVRNGNSLKTSNPVSRRKKSSKTYQRPQSAKTKLSYKQKRELRLMPITITELESELEFLRKKASSAEFFKIPYSETKPILDSIIKLETEIELLMKKWESLEMAEEK